MSDKLKTSYYIAAIVSFVFLFVLASASAAGENTVWTKYDNSVPATLNSPGSKGRIPLGTAGKGDAKYAYGSIVIKDGSTYKMWYSGYDAGSSARIYYAFSPDGLNWTKYDNNIPGPSDSICTNGTIPLGTSGGDTKQVNWPSVIKDGALYKMWYSGSDGTNYRIYHATSSDGLTWTKKNNAVPAVSDTTSDDGRIPLGTAGKGDDYYSAFVSVIKDDSTYKMWYSAHNGTNWRVYYATSSDSLNWTKYSNSVPSNSNTTGTDGRIPLGTSGGDTVSVYSPRVIKDDSTYRMWYTGYGVGSKYCVYNATSTDGLTWTKVDNAVPDDSNTTSTNGRIPLGTSGGGDDTRVISSTIIKDGDTYKMWYGGYVSPNYRTYHATSTDSLTWTKYDNTEPAASDLPAINGRIPLGSSGKGDDEYIVYPAVIKDGSTYKMWYSGFKSSDSKYRIYYATSPDGLIWVKYNNAFPAASNTNGTDGRVPIGLAGTGDEKYALIPTVIKDGSFYKMWYCGRDGSNKSRIYYATSSNGLTWLKYTNAIPPTTSDTTNWGKGRIPFGTTGGDTARTYAPSVIKEGSTYKMWYEGSDGTNYRIYYATSTDCLTWTKYSNSVPDASNTTGTYGRIPLGESGAGDDTHVGLPTVIKVSSNYKMWYAGHDGSTWRIYYATSTDGLTWTKCTNAVPSDSDTTSTYGRIPRGVTGGDTNSVSGACVINEGVIQDGYTYKMWYGGSDNVKQRIYHATCEQPPVEGTIFYSY